MNAFEIANLFIKNTEGKEKQSRWISVKQSNWLKNTMPSEESFVHDKHPNEGGKWTNTRSIENNQYLVKLYISPMNEAGYLTIEYKDIHNQQRKNENQEKLDKLQTELKEYSEGLEEYNRLGIGEENVYFRVLTKKYNEALKEINWLTRV